MAVDHIHRSLSVLSQEDTGQWQSEYHGLDESACSLDIPHVVALEVRLEHKLSIQESVPEVSNRDILLLDDEGAILPLARRLGWMIPRPVLSNRHFSSSRPLVTLPNAVRRGAKFIRIIYWYAKSVCLSCFNVVFRLNHPEQGFASSFPCRSARPDL